MGKYDFTTIIDRTKMDSLKWANMRNKKPDVGRGVVPLSTADMEFMSPPELIGQLQKYIGEVILGYSYKTKDYEDAVIGWVERQHGWIIKPEWIVETQGVVNALFTAVQSFTKPGDGVILLTPIYHPFYVAVERTKRQIKRAPLRKDSEGVCALYD